MHPMQVHDIVSLGKHENDGEAMKMLQQIAKQVGRMHAYACWRVERAGLGHARFMQLVGCLGSQAVPDARNRQPW